MPKRHFCITLPLNLNASVAKSVLLEVREASLADAPSTLLASKKLSDVHLLPNGKINTDLEFSSPQTQQTLIVRAHISVEGSDQIKQGDLLTTEFIQIPSTYESDIINVPVSLI